MAVVDIAKSGGLYSYIGLSASDTGEPLFLGGGWGVFMCVTAASGGGSGFNSGTLTIQVSNDGTNWATLKDIHGTDVTFTATGTFELSTAAKYIRASCDASISDVDVYFNFG